MSLNARELRERAVKLVRREHSDIRELLAMDSPSLADELSLHQVELELQNEQLRSVERDLVLQNEQLHSVERDLELSRTEYEELFDLAPVGYVCLDASGLILRANRAGHLLLGVEQEGLILRSLAEFTEGRDLRGLRAHLRAAAQGHETCEIRLRRPDGSGVHALLESRAAFSGGCLTVLTDISERKRAQDALSQANQQLLERTSELASRNAELEEALRARAASDAERSELAARLRTAERLESLGLLAGGIAHDFNNLLVGVLAHAELLLETMPDLSVAVQDGLVTIQRAARSAAELTRQLLIYAGRGHVTLQSVLLDDLIRQSVHLFEPRARGRIELCAELAAEGHRIQADAGQVHQVLGNLLTNALEALGESAGRVVVRTRLEQLDAQALARFPHADRAKPGRFVVVEVEDTGVGIDAAQLPRIFEPFFTSKFTGRGLGLASVLGIVRSHNAALRVRSVLAQGSTFEIAWPLCALASVSEAPLHPADARPWKGSGQVLVVDDDPVVLQSLARQFEQLGFVVTRAGSGAEAIELFRAQPSRFRLAVVDRTMPGVGGDRVIELLHELEPALPVVLVSGYSEGERAADRDQVAFVAKPMTLSDLRRAVTQLLDARPISC